MAVGVKNFATPNLQLQCIVDKTNLVERLWNVFNVVYSRALVEVGGGIVQSQDQGP